MMMPLFKKNLVILVCVLFAATSCISDSDGGSGGEVADANLDAEQTSDVGQPDSDNDDTGDDTDTSVDAAPDAAPDAEPDTNDDPECRAGEAYCDNQCTDILESTENCGGCGQSCPTWNASCVDGSCICDTASNPNLVYCVNDGFCIDPTLDPDNCGTCGNVCGDAEVCYEGACKTRPELVTEFTNAHRSTPTNCGTEGSFPSAGPLQLDFELSKAAQVHAVDMKENEFFDHTGSDGSDFSMRIGRTNYMGNPVGENIAAGQTSSQEVVDGWVDSDGHCANIMNANATKIGVGYIEHPNPGPDGYQTYWVQVFGN
jgi:hypothetical protein